MSEAQSNPEGTRPVSAQSADFTGEIPAASDVAIEDIVPVDANMWRAHRWQEYFERLRNEDPVHFNETELEGRFWSLTRYEHIKKVDSDWQNFSSALGLVL